MTSFVHVTYPLQHPGVVRFERVVIALRQVPVWAALALAAIGAPVRARLDASAARRRLAREDVRFWNAAQHDARLMADIQGAIAGQALDQIVK